MGKVVEFAWEGQPILFMNLEVENLKSFVIPF